MSWTNLFLEFGYVAAVRVTVSNK